MPTPIQQVMDAIIEAYTPYRVGSDDPAQKAAVAAYYRRFSRPVKEILDFALQDPDAAIKGIKAIERRMAAANLDWNLNTASRWFPEWFSNPAAFEAETKRREYGR